MLLSYVMSFARRANPQAWLERATLAADMNAVRKAIAAGGEAASLSAETVAKGLNRMPPYRKIGNSVSQATRHELVDVLAAHGFDRWDDVKRKVNEGSLFTTREIDDALRTSRIQLRSGLSLE